MIDADLQQRMRDLSRLRRIRDRIDREHARPLDLELLARGEHMSSGHLIRAFRDAYGETGHPPGAQPARIGRESRSGADRAVVSVTP